MGKQEHFNEYKYGLDYSFGGQVQRQRPDVKDISDRLFKDNTLRTGATVTGVNPASSNCRITAWKSAFTVNVMGNSYNTTEVRRRIVSREAQQQLRVLQYTKCILLYRQTTVKL